MDDLVAIATLTLMIGAKFAALDPELERRTAKLIQRGYLLSCENGSSPTRTEALLRERQRSCENGSAPARTVDNSPSRRIKSASS